MASPSATVSGEVRPQGKRASVVGFASTNGKRVIGGKVRVFVRPAGKSKFSKQLKVRRPGKAGGLSARKASGRMMFARTNVVGGFYMLVDKLPSTFLIKVDGGRLGKNKPFKGTLTAIGQRRDRGVVVSPVTMITAKYMTSHPKVSARTASKRVGKFLKVKGLRKSTDYLGMKTWTPSKDFSPSVFANAASNNGGVGKFTSQLAKKVKKGKHRTFRDKNYRPLRASFPLSGPNGQSRIAPVQAKSGKGKPTAKLASVAESLMDEVAAAGVYAETCAFVGASIAGNLACPEPPNDAPLVDALGSINEQLEELNAEVADIDSELAVMETQLTNITNLNEDILQSQLQTEAVQAQQNYSNAYDTAGIAQIQAQVDAANSDMQYLYAAEPPPNTVTGTVSPTASINQQCAAVYSTVNASNGQNPYDLCKDYLTQMEAGFAGTTQSYYKTLYNGLTGANSTPQENLLVYTLQQMLTSAGNSPVPQTTLLNMQEQYGQLSALQDAAFAMLAAGQMFSYAVTTGDLTQCPDIPTSGTYPSDTPVVVADACETILSGLFADSVVDTLAAQVAVPIANTVADQRTNALWWAYPVDTSIQTTSSGSYPYYPGAPSGTYTNLTETCSIGLVGFTPSGAYWNTCGAKILTNHEYNFKLSNAGQTQAYLTDMMMTSGQTMANAFTTQGFEGIGSTSYGMSWTKLGADPDWTPYPIYTGYQWQDYPTTATDCSGYPPRIAASFEWTGYICSTSGGLDVTGLFPQHMYDLTQTQLPTTSTACPLLGTRYTTTWTTSGTGICWGPNTFALLIDTDAPAPNGPANGVLPPFWAPYLLVGAPATVPIIPIPAPTPTD